MDFILIILVGVSIIFALDKVEGLFCRCRDNSSVYSDHTFSILPGYELSDIEIISSSHEELPIIQETIIENSTPDIKISEEIQPVVEEVIIEHPVVEKYIYKDKAISEWERSSKVKQDLMNKYRK